MNFCDIRRFFRWLVGAAALGSLLPGALLAQPVTATIPVPAVDVAVNPVTNTIYALSNGNIVAVIDGATNNVPATIILASGGSRHQCNQARYLCHTLATRAVAARIDLPTLRPILGYTNVTMTVRYVQPAEEQKRLCDQQTLSVQA